MAHKISSKGAKASYEGSAADKAKDEREAKKRGIPLSKWEGSREDEKMDASMARRLAKRAKKR